MRTNSFFTIVIPTYNRANLIEKTLKTIFAQSYTNYEIIVVDNCSTDNTKEVLEPYIRAGKISYYCNLKNEERSFSRNVGMDKARGDFLTFLDSDDYMYPENLADAANFIKENSHIQFFHNFYELVNTNGEPIYQYRFPSINNHVKALSDGNFLSCIGVFISKEIYSSYRFEISPEIIGSEDWEFWLRIAARYSLKRIPKINNGIVNHPGRTINKFSLESVISRKKFIIDKILINSDLKKVYTNYISNINGSACLLAASIANSNGMYNEALKYVKRAFQEHKMQVFSLKFIRILQIALFQIQHKNKI